MYLCMLQEHRNSPPPTKRQPGHRDPGHAARVLQRRVRGRLHRHGGDRRALHVLYPRAHRLVLRALQKTEGALDDVHCRG